MLRSRQEPHHPPAAVVQRQIHRTRSVNALHGVDLDAILRNPRSSGLRRLVSLCEGSSRTHLQFDTYSAGRNEAGETRVFVTDNNGRTRDLSDTERIDWRAVDKNSPVTIRVKINSGRVVGRAQDVETLLHELAVHAVEFVPLIQRMRVSHKNAIRGIWTRVMHDAGDAMWESQHQRLGEGFNRDLSAEMGGMSRHLERQGMDREHLDQEYWMDMLNHHPYAPHYQGGP
jgi:hypothetical protein